MNKLTIIVAALIVFPVASAGAQVAQVIAPPPTTQPATQPAYTPTHTQPDNGPYTIRMTVHPVAESRPALQNKLLPSLRDTKNGNAVTLYYIAVDMLSKNVSDQIRDTWDAWGEVPLDHLDIEAARAGTKTTSLKYVRLGARRAQCQWDYPLEEGFALLLPSLNKHRTIAYSLALDTRIAIAEKRYDDAIINTQTGLSFARHIASGPTLIEDLVGIAVATISLNQVDLLIQQPDAPNLYWALTDLPRPFISLRDAMKLESDMLYISYPLLDKLAHGEANTLTAEHIRYELQQMTDDIDYWIDGKSFAPLMFGISLIQYTHAKHWLAERGYTAVQIERMPVAQAVCLYMLTEYEEARDDMFKWFALPYWQARDGLSEAAKKIDAPSSRGNPFMRLLSAMSRAKFLEVKLDCRIQMMRCVEAIRLHAAATGSLPDALGDITLVPLPTNPITGKPFQYTRDGDNFTLEADLLDGMRPSDGMRYIVTIKPNS